MTLTHHPGSGRQIAAICTGAGHARDIVLKVTEAHAVISDLADGAAPAAAQAAACLRDADSACTPDSPAGAPGEIITRLHQARRSAMAGIPPVR